MIGAARVMTTLAEAVAGCRLVVGTTSGARRKPERPLESLSGFRIKGKTALVFGSEKHGLDNEELSYCQKLLRIPTVPATPAMNLAASVAVCCYELVREKKQGKRNEERVAEVGKVLFLLDQAAALLEAARFLDPQRRASHLRKLRQIVLRAGLRPEDVALLTTAVAKLQYALTTSHGL